MVGEFYDQFVRPAYLARYLEALFSDTGLRDWQLAGFDEVRRRLATDRPAGEIAAAAVMEVAKDSRAGQ